MRIISKKKVIATLNILTENNLDATVFMCSDSYHDSSIEYLTGFRQERIGAFSCLVATKKKMTLIVSAMDSDQAHADAEVEEIIEIKKSRFGEVLKEALGKSKNIGISSDMPMWMIGMLKGRKTLDISREILNIRSIKEPKEIELIKSACSITNHGIKFIEKELCHFRNCKELSIELESKMLRKGADEIAFSTLATSGKRGLWIHPYPAASHDNIKNIGLVDFGVRIGGYCSDVTVPFTKGNLTEKQKLMLKTVKDAYSESVSRIDVGEETNAIFDVANNIITKNGFEFKHSLGHGIGLDVHEFPNISPKPHDKKQLIKWKPTILKENMVFTIEPGVYEKDGGFRLENDFLLTRKGPKKLTNSRFLEF